MSETTALHRPVGAKELQLISESGFAASPPRLPEQPIFYPVLNEEYAVRVVPDRNAKYNEPKRGYVTRFPVKTDFLQNYEVRTAGGSLHQEYWIPAEDLPRFNQNIVGKIEDIAGFGDETTGL